MPTTMATKQAEPVAVRVADVARMTGMSVREVWRRAADDLGDFPRPRKLSPRVTVWNYADVKSWAEGKTH